MGSWLILWIGILVGFSEQTAARGSQSECIANSAVIPLSLYHSLAEFKLFLDSNLEQFDDISHLFISFQRLYDLILAIARWDCKFDWYDLIIWLNDLWG